MEDRRFIKPIAGGNVIDPATGRALAAHGKGVIWNSWWQRRLDQADVEMTTETAVTTAERKGGAAEKEEAK